MPYRPFEIPTGEFASEVVVADLQNSQAPAFVHYAMAKASSMATWNGLQQDRARPFSAMLDAQYLADRFPEATTQLQSNDAYWPGRGALVPTLDTKEACLRTALRLGALELLANVHSGRILPGEKDPFPHQLAVQQFAQDHSATLKRMLIADEVGLGKTIEMGLLIRQRLLAHGDINGFSCLYVTRGGLVPDAADKLRSVLKGAVGQQNIVDPVERLRDLRPFSGVRILSLDAARRYLTKDKKKLLQPGIAPDIIVIDECHHCASDDSLAGKDVSNANTTQAYRMAYQMLSGDYWPGSAPPKLFVLMSATPFRSAPQFTNLMRLLIHGVDGYDAYSSEADTPRLLDAATRFFPQVAVVWRQQDDVADWEGKRLFPVTTVIRPGAGPAVVGPPNEPQLGAPSQASLLLMADIEAAVAAIAARRAETFSGFGRMQLSKQLTSSSVAGAMYLFRWALRRCRWATQDAFKQDLSPGIQQLRSLARAISQKLAQMTTGSAAQHATLVFSDGFTYSAQELAQRGAIWSMYEHHQKLRADDADDDTLPIADNDIGTLAELAVRLLGGDDTPVENLKLMWLSSMLALYPSSKFLVFTESRQTCEILATWLGTASRKLTGDLSVQQRSESIRAFSTTSSIRVLVMTAAGDEGLDLQVANRVVHWDLHPSPAVLMQRNGRAARLGQIADVLAYYLVLPGTFEENRENALFDRFAALGITDETLRLKILGSLSDEDSEWLDEAIRQNNANVVERILSSAHKGHEDMMSHLARIRTDVHDRHTLDRSALEARMEKWLSLGIPDDTKFDLRLTPMRWKKPIFDAKTKLLDAVANVLSVTCDGELQGEYAFDPLFRLFGGSGAAYRLAGILPWTWRTTGKNDRLKLRPVVSSDPLGNLVGDLARMRRADFATLRRASIPADTVLAETAYLVFVTHPMLEGELDPGSASHLTFYQALVDGQLIEGRSASAREVTSIVGALESVAHERAFAAVELQQVVEVARSIAAQLENRTKVTGSLFGAGPTRHCLPIAVAIVAVTD